MATIINPITTVLVNRAEFESGEYSRFPFTYILEDDGTISYYSALTAGRFLLSHEAKIGGLKTGTDKAPIAAIQPLAHGNKIPGEFFYQIKQFFLDVMDMGPSTYEAQTFVVWNEVTETYRIVIPEQTVSAAAVRYDIGDLLGSDDIIILDIHSHNDMGAFFSGTDDADDKKNPWISGVFGKLSTDMQNKFRFNDGCGRHFEMNAEDVFDFKDARFQTPAEWIQQVKIQPATYKRYNPAFTKAPEPRKINSWGEAFRDTGNQREAFDEGWNAVNTDDLDFSNLFGNEASHSLSLLEDPESDFYDEVLDALTDATPLEISNVVNSLIAGITDTTGIMNALNTLSDEESVMFLEIDFAMRKEGDLIMAERVLQSVLSDFTKEA